MGSMNLVVLIGHLGRDAELKFSAGGQAVTTLNLATSEAWIDKAGQKKEATEWHRVVVFGKQAESLAAYLTKGKQISVRGKLQTRMWEKDGEKRYTTEVRADHIELLGGGTKGERREEEPAMAGVAAGSDHSEPVDDDIPFMWLVPFILPALGLLGVLSA